MTFKHMFHGSKISQVISLFSNYEFKNINENKHQDICVSFQIFIEKITNNKLKTFIIVLLPYHNIENKIYSHRI